MTWRVLIADDEPAARRGVLQLLAAYPKFTVVGECRNGEEVLAALDLTEADVIFLDVQMPGADAFEVIRRRTPERMPAVVFLTAYDDYALRAFEVQALDYLVKPVSRARFAATMRRLVRHLSVAKRAETIMVSTASGVHVLPVGDIEWIEAADNYARLWIGRRSYLVRQSLRELETRLQPHGFARVHRCALVRLDRVHALTGEAAVLSSGARIPVSRRQRTMLLAALRRAAV